LRRQLERLARENDRLREQVAEQAQQITDQRERIADQQRRLADQEKQIADLERQLAARSRNSTNSSKPPSSDGLAGQPRRRGRSKKSQRPPGGQKGHPGAHRVLVPAERVHQVQRVLPAQCQHCGRPLPQQESEIQAVGEVRRHQVTELPPLAAHIIEYQCPKVVCPGCGQGTRAPLPEEAQGQNGARLTALVAYLTVVCRMPRRVVEELLEQVLGISMSLGSTQKCWEETSQAVAAPCQQLQEHLQQEPVLNVDETGWRTNGEKRYLWAFVASLYVVYTVAKTRSSQVLLQLLGAVFAGILCSDRFVAYLKYHQGRAQFCWAHLKRNILGILDFAKTSEVERFCRDALALHARLFRLWYKFRSDLIDRQQLRLRSLPLQRRFFALAERHLDSEEKEVRNLATALFQHSERLFTFLEYEGVEPTNNSAEQALRRGVEWRKICFGNRSTKGEVATARLLTVTETCRRQQRNALGYLAEALICHRRHQPVTSLLPRQ
jgi:transposase